MLRARPRSTFGLVGYLASLYLRRRSVRLAIACGALVVLGALVTHFRLASPPGELRATSDMQAAVLRDGFVVRHAATAGHRVVELDRDGRERRVFTVERSGELRAVGTRAGTAVAWQDGRKIRLAR
jgi:hypothetical protein